MSFRIEYVGPTDQPHLALGRIQIGAFSEHFRMDLSYWDQAMYEAQWRTGITRLLEGAKTSCVIQSLGDPRTANFLVWWPMYVLEGGVVAVQNSILFMEELDEAFDPTDPYRFVGPREKASPGWHGCTDRSEARGGAGGDAREKASEDGNRISEWKTTLAELV